MSTEPEEYPALYHATSSITQYRVHCYGDLRETFGDLKNARAYGIELAKKEERVWISKHQIRTICLESYDFVQGVKHKERKG